MKRANFDLSLRVGRDGEAREEKNKTERSAAGKEKGNGGHFLEKQKGKARQSQVGRKQKDMEDTLLRNKRELGGQKGNGGHSKHDAQTDAGKEKKNGGHFLEKQKAKAEQSQGGQQTQRYGGHWTCVGPT